jgi:hypothetical protein
VILRTTEWDGLDPAPGDVIQLPDDQLAVVTAVASGPGLGQWRIDADPARVITWHVPSAPCPPAS